VAQVVGAAWQGLDAGGVTPVVKHFPGHGSVTADSHATLPVQSRTVAEMESRDLVPFAAAVRDGVPAVMMGHIRVPEWGKAPASLNPHAYAYLRETLGFEGLAVTDALNMAAVADLYSSSEAAVAAVRAGADLVVMPADTDKAIAGIEAAVTRGKLSRERLDEAVARVILAAREQASAAPSAVEPTRPQAFVDHSIVVAARDCDKLIGSAVKVSGGTKAQRAMLRKELRAQGVKIDPAGTPILLVDGDRGHGKAAVVVALGGPWGLPTSTAHAYVATWGTGVAQMRALAGVLAGDIRPRGDWPVAVKLPHPVCR
jgi:beta-N-acetylhexosaminidase